MRVDILSSGSKGNAYAVSDGYTPLLLDAGIPFSRLQERLRFEVGRKCGVLLSHEHGDHSMAIKRLMEYGVDVYSGALTFEALGLKGHRAHVVKKLQAFTIGTFRIMPFDVEHDAAEPLGFLLESTKTGERLLYFTDTAYLRYKIDRLEYIMGECNYSMPIARGNALDGEVDVEVVKRLPKTHMSLETFMRFLQSVDKSRLKEVYLLHMSDHNGNESEFSEAVKKIVGDNVEIIVA